MSTDSEIPEWLHVGAKVACHALGNVLGNRVTAATVTKIGKRDVVLDNGSRFNVRSLSRSTGQWSPTVYLKPLDDPAVQRDLARDLRRKTARMVEECLKAWIADDDDTHAERAARAMDAAVAKNARSSGT